MRIKENDQYHHMTFFFSDDKEPLEKIRVACETNGDVWSLDEYPLIIKKLIINHSENFKKYKYFFFRVWAEAEGNNPISEDDASDIADMFAQNNKSLLFTSHSNKYVKAISEAIIRGTIDGIEFSGPDVIELTDADTLQVTA